MADIQLNSLQNSALARALIHGNTSISDFDYKLTKSTVPFSKNKVDIALKETDFNKTVRLKIPKIGLMQNMTLKLAMDIKSSDTEPNDGSGNVFAKRGGGLLAIKQCRITNGKDTLLSINGEVLNTVISSYDYKKEYALKQACGYSGVPLSMYNENGINPGGNFVNKYTAIRSTGGNDYYGYAVVYIPLLFSPFVNDEVSEYMDFSFYQQLYLEIDFAPYTDVWAGSFSSTLKPSIKWANSKVICNYVNFENDEYTKIQKLRHGKDLNYVWRDYWYNDDVTSVVSGNSLTKVTVDLPCDKLMRRIFIRVDNQYVNGDADKIMGMSGCDSIHSVQLNAVGRTINEWDGDELLLLANYHNVSGHNAPWISKYYKNDKNNNKDYEQSVRNDLTNQNVSRDHAAESVYYVIDFTMNNALKRNSNPAFNGGIRLTGNMNAELVLQLKDVLDDGTDTNGKKVVVKTWCEYYSVWKVKSNSGEIEIADNK